MSSDTDRRWGMGVRHVINLDLPRRDVFRQIRMAEAELWGGVNRHERLLLIRAYMKAVSDHDLDAIQSLGTILASLEGYCGDDQEA